MNETCECEGWAEGGIHLHIESNADGSARGLTSRSDFPRRTAVSKRFVARLNDPANGIPGAAEWDGRGRLIIRVDGGKEVVYVRRGECSCGYIMVERG